MDASFEVVENFTFDLRFSLIFSITASFVLDFGSFNNVMGHSKLRPDSSQGPIEKKLSQGNS